MVEHFALLGLNDLIYSSALDAALLPIAPSAVCRAFGGDSRAFALHDSTIRAGGDSRRRSGSWPLSVMIAPFRGERELPPSAGAALFVCDAEASASVPEDQPRRLYGLIQAEARTALALLDSDRLAQVAAKLHVSLGTVRTLLQGVFEKTQTRRPAELVRLLPACRVLSGSASTLATNTDQRRRSGLQVRASKTDWRVFGPRRKS